MSNGENSFTFSARQRFYGKKKRSREVSNPETFYNKLILIIVFFAVGKQEDKRKNERKYFRHGNSKPYSVFSYYQRQ